MQHISESITSCIHRKKFIKQINYSKNATDKLMHEILRQGSKAGLFCCFFKTHLICIIMHTLETAASRALLRQCRRSCASWTEPAALGASSCSYCPDASEACFSGRDGEQRGLQPWAKRLFSSLRDNTAQALTCQQTPNEAHPSLIQGT